MRQWWCGRCCGTMRWYCICPITIAVKANPDPMVVRPEHIQRPQIVHLGEAGVDLRFVEALARIVDVGSGKLEQHRSQLIVDLLVIGALRLTSDGGIESLNIEDAPLDE